MAALGRFDLIPTLLQYLVDDLVELGTEKVLYCRLSGKLL